MYLSKLEVHGFKSFAQKTNVRFDSGITAIVGPNGCGKTNVADAIRWVLGEHKASTLRADKMENVIFNGTRNRKPLGMAEVSLTIENTKNILPTEYTEVTLTRRLFRSGESEYLLNKVPCRLKDIVDLFMDTGMGSDAYSVIELKMIEDILSERADDRRKLFEEAAGVTKYKSRRKQALRKLEQTSNDLIRIQDLVSEVQKNVNSLERQAKKAEQYKTYVDELKKLEIEHAERNYSLILKKLIPLNDQLAVVNAESAELSAELGTSEASMEVIQTELIRLEEKLSLLQKEYNLQRDKVGQKEQKIALNKQNKANYESNIERSKREKKETFEAIDELNFRVKEAEAQIDNFKNLISSAEGAYNIVQETSKSFEIHLNEKRKDAAEINTKSVALLNQLSAKKSEIERFKSRKDSISQRIENIEKENENLQENREDLTAELDELRFSEKQIIEELALAEDKVKNHGALIEEARQSLDAARQQISLIAVELQSKNQRKSFLNSIYESFEGVPEGVRYLLQNEKAKNLTTISDIITVKKEEWLPVITQWLGDKANYVIASNETEAISLLGKLKQEKKGVASFILLDRLKSISVSSQSISGAVSAETLLTSQTQYENLLKTIFNGVYLVESDEAAASLFKQNPHFTFLTKSGLSFSEQAVIKGGESSHEGHSRIGISEKIHELEKEIAELEQKKNQQESEVYSLKLNLENLQTQNVDQQLKDVQRKHVDIEKNISNVDFSLKNFQTRIEKNKEEISRLGDEYKNLEEQIDELMPGADELQFEINKLQKSASEVAESLKKIETEWQLHSSEAQEARAKLVGFQGDLQNAVNEKTRLASQSDALKSQINRRDEEIRTATEMIHTLEKDTAETESDLIDLLQDQKELQVKVETLELEVGQKRGDVRRLEEDVRDRRKRKDNAVELSQQIQSKITEHQIRFETLKNHVRDNYQIELEPKEFEDENEFDAAKLEDEIKRYKERVRNLGTVNALALEEYEKEKERLTFMTTQRDDLVAAEKTLQETIEEINRTAQAQFLEVFNQIKENFNKTFLTLFDPGDEADLILEENVDPLEAKIEIIAKPRGKRPQSIMLLSGGEKTLTAIALLFAIYLVKPSPFCILDEVDAPLDDANIDRYTKIIKKFSENTQFIMITHNKRTMESANMMYGVTMEEKGVSKLVSVKFDEAKQAS